MHLIVLSWSTAGAADVVWLGSPSDDERRRVAEIAGATGPALSPLDLRAAATRWTDDDDRALEDLDAALEASRAYETQLDGELLILRDLEGPVTGVGALRNQGDRGRLFAALTYQGFAVARYWGETLAEDTEAEPWRAEFKGRVVERPWLDAVAIEPDREITPYEIAEAPQRVAYADVMAHVAGALPATLTPVDQAQGASLFVDGRAVAVGPSGNVKVLPGRHLVHAEIDGVIVDRWDVRVASGGDARLEPRVASAVWTSFLDGVAPGAEVPGAVRALVDALGGGVWLAVPADRDPIVLRVAGDRLEPVELPRESGGGEGGGDGPGVELSAGALAGWLSSGDFYVQDPTTPNTRATVNAASLGGWATAEARLSLLRVGAGIDVIVPLGEHHLALTGDEGRLRVRPIPHVAVGLPWVQATAGYLFPYHPAVGGRARAPLPGPLELRALGWLGLPTTRDRGDGSEAWVGLPVYTLAGGVGATFR